MCAHSLLSPPLTFNILCALRVCDKTEHLAFSKTIVDGGMWRLKPEVFWMANPWLTFSLASPLDPTAPAGNLSRPPLLPDPPDPANFPPLPSSRSPPPPPQNPLSVFLLLLQCPLQVLFLLLPQLKILFRIWRLILPVLLQHPSLFLLLLSFLLLTHHPSFPYQTKTLDLTKNLDLLPPTQTLLHKSPLPFQTLAFSLLLSPLPLQVSHLFPPFLTPRHQTPLQSLNPLLPGLLKPRPTLTEH
ncbi:hypothetical protein YC2023_013901 [Brassica napus]